MNSLVFSATDKPLYLQIYETLREDIHSGKLKANEKLPSKRLLAQNLNVSVNTVDTAYQMLVAEGYAAARPKSGFFVCRIPKSFLRAGQAQKSEEGHSKESWKFNFETSSIDTSLFPFKLWCRIQREALLYPELLNHGDRQGDLNLRQAVAAYLHEYRGVSCNAGSIFIGAGIEYLLCVLARMFANKEIAIEEPGYERAASVMRGFGAKTVYAQVDENGMSAAALSKTNAAAAYLTPSCQFPTGVTMPVSRRLELLKWAADNDRYLIEDDYNSEFRFSTRPVPALQGLDTNGCVIYIGTFSKSVAPSIRVAYMVLPPRLLVRFNTEYSYFSSTVSRFEQQALCAFLNNGHFARHLNRLRTACRKRRDALIAQLNLIFKNKVKISAAQTGLHIVAHINNGMTEQELIESAQKYGVNMTGLSSYYHIGKADGTPAVILGYSALSEEEIVKAVNILAQAWGS